MALVPLRVEVGSATSPWPEKRWVLIWENNVAESPKKARRTPETVPEVEAGKLAMLAARAARYLENSCSHTKVSERRKKKERREKKDRRLESIIAAATSTPTKVRKL